MKGVAGEQATSLGAWRRLAVLPCVALRLWSCVLCGARDVWELGGGVCCQFQLPEELRWRKVVRHTRRKGACQAGEGAWPRSCSATLWCWLFC